MEQTMIFKDLMEDFKEYFKTHPNLLPTGVILENVNIIGEADEFPLYGRTEKRNWQVVFMGDLGKPEWIQNYDLIFNGLQLVDVRKSNPQLPE
jgi:hypothetical protein